MFLQNLYSNPTFFCMVVLIVVFSITLHEFFHAWVAFREGDYTVEDHLTLNPLKQMGFMSLLMLALVGIAWGMVPVQRDLLRSKHSMLKISLAGPAANLLLMILAWLLLFFGASRYMAGYFDNSIYIMILKFIQLLGIYNFVLLIFNLLPAPGLDGWTVLAELFPQIRNIKSEVAKGFMLLLMLLAFVGVRYLMVGGRVLMNLGLILGSRIGG